MSNTTLFFEEVEQYATSYYMPQNFKTLIDVGRHRGLGLTCTARRTARVNKDLLFNADHIIAFHQHLPGDLDFLAEYMGEKVYQLPKLPQFYFLWYEDRTGKTYICKPV